MAIAAKAEGFRVIISGGGIAGLTLANALQHASIDYILLEARGSIAPQVGASIGIAPNGSRILDQLGCYDDIVRMTEPITWSGNHNKSGDYINPPSDAPQLLRHAYAFAFIDRQLVLEVLANHIQDKSKMLLNKRLSKVDHSANAVVVHCTDGTSYTGDIVVGADGVNSIVREQMWQVADIEDPGAIPQQDKTSMRSEYQVLYGISTAVDDLPKGRYDVTYMKDFSTMVITGKDAVVYWFLFKRMDQVYKKGNIPKYNKEDAEAFGQGYRDVNIMPKGSIKFGQIWKNRKSYTLVATEEAEYTKWTWNRFACLGDSIHKVTPNAGAGGNAAIESAAALANAIRAMLDKGEGRPSLEAVKQCLTSFQKSRDERSVVVAKIANKLTRIHALKGVDDVITVNYIMPNAGDYLLDMQSDLWVGATKLEYMAPPPLSLEAAMPFNPEQGAGNNEKRLYRAFLALPFLGLLFLASRCMDVAPAIPAIGKMMKSGSITWDSGSIPVRGTFYHIKWLDDIWRPVTIVFASWNLEIDPVGWWQMLTFITDFGVLYSIFLIESARRANQLTLATLPIIFGLAAQLRGIGIIGQIYFFLHYLFAQISNFNALDKRLTSLAYTRSVLPAMVLSYYIPHFLSHLHPTLTARHDWDWIWQMFPVWVAIIQRVLAHTVMPDTVEHDRIYAPKRDLPTIRITIGACVALSTGVWLYTLSMSPYSPLTLFIPSLGASTASMHWTEVIRNFVQYDDLFCFGGALLWLAYLFGDLKGAGMMTQSWIRIVSSAILTVTAMGPGAAVGLGWLWRESVLANACHKAAIIKGKGEGVVGEKLPHVNGNGHAKKVNGTAQH